MPSFPRNPSMAFRELCGAPSGVAIFLLGRPPQWVTSHGFPRRRTSQPPRLHWYIHPRRPPMGWLLVGFGPPPLGLVIPPRAGVQPLHQEPGGLEHNLSFPGGGYEGPRDLGGWMNSTLKKVDLTFISATPGLPRTIARPWSPIKGYPSHFSWCRWRRTQPSAPSPRTA